MKKKYLLFVGQNASTGTPNLKTGYMSFYGNTLRFSSIKKRTKYINNHNFTINDTIISTDVRRYNLGMSVNDYNEHIQLLDFTD